MPWKDGVKTEEVLAFRELVKLAKELEEKIDAGTATPKDALQQVAEAAKKVKI